VTREQATTGSVAETKRPTEPDGAPSAPKEVKRPTETGRATSSPKSAITGSIAETEHPAETNRATPAPKQTTTPSVAEAERLTETDKATSAPKQETTDSVAEAERPAKSNGAIPAPKQETAGFVAETKRPTEPDGITSSPKPETTSSIAETKHPAKTDGVIPAPKQETAGSDAEVEHPAETDGVSSSPKPETPGSDAKAERVAETDEAPSSPEQETAGSVSEMLSAKRRNRVQITGVQPEIEGGRYPIKRIVDDVIEITADIVVDGHNALAAVLCYKEETQSEWSETPLEHAINDRWQAQLRVDRLGRWQYTVEAWIDDFASWQRDLEKRVNAAQDVAMDLLIGLDLVKQAAQRASTADQDAFSRCIEVISNRQNVAEVIRVSLSGELADLMRRHPDREHAARYKEILQVVVDPKQALFSAWYEVFPRSCSPHPGAHGNFNDLIARLPYIADMGFDVLYLPPIHPIGTTHRKGKNNNPVCEPGDVGSPWAIGAAEGGHMSIHPQLGTLADFRKLVAQAKVFGISIALDLAFQCSPDHPYVKEHPEWFRMRPDNTIQYAENPPKKYQDIYPLEFQSPAWEALWEELRRVVMYWIDQGVRVFRVDNPHTKDFSFWEWLIESVKKEAPDTIFLAEAFTRPKLMGQLAKLGFTQSYTYFAWRNSKWELEDYLITLTTTDLREYFRPNFWPNTPDILNDYLQIGGPPAFKARLVLAATLSSNYGIYGPPFDLCDGLPVEIGSEEYMNSEKYEIRSWNLDEPHSLKHYIAQVNKIRRENAVLQSNDNLEFYPVDNENIICYGKHSDDFSEILIVTVNLDPNWVQSGWLKLPIDEFDLPPDRPFQVHDLLDDRRYLWTGSRNFVQLEPHTAPAHIFRLRRYQRSERDFDYYF